ncbi:outer membrane beta-barrel protein [Chryseobacterium sp.]|uniref:outer membrane beta-barrel protein n=1 Tax=Chryseobacterium sp. TaxID=1871047 RepID=UPI0011C95EF9|nr:outer membrane beta-barrel protein [Chryseobacterium sp.]TXF76182.1 PorT family protein [Chryseobacterium sp.]
MIKLFSALFIGLSVFSTAQISVAAKANLLFPTSSSSWKNISASAVEAYDKDGKNNVGFNAGLSVKMNILSSLFIMPEIYYTTFKNEFTDPVSNTKFEAKSNRVDVPVLVGYKVLGDNLGLFIGPVASYNLAGDDQFNDFKENALKEFTVGFQFGAQLQIKDFIVNGRYEGAFSNDQRDFINKNTNQTIRYDSRPSLFIVGAGYQF